MKRIMLLWCMLAAPAALACQKGEPNRETAPAAAASATLTDEAVDRAAIPVKADFEEEAYASINEDNFEAEIDRLEQEIGSDSP